MYFISIPAFLTNGACCSYSNPADQHIPVVIIASSDKAAGKLLSYRAYFPSLSA
tara:strand:+ start:80 stop:241 length:162 start_codon:yes stop_codon:yes gene_type:complete